MIYSSALQAPMYGSDRKHGDVCPCCPQRVSDNYRSTKDHKKFVRKRRRIEARQWRNEWR